MPVNDRPSVVAGFIRRDAPETTVRAPVHQQPVPFIPMLDIRDGVGKRIAISYVHILWIEMDDQQRVQIHTPKHFITLSGRSLGPLYDQLVAHCVGIVCATDPKHDVAGPDQPAVYAVQVELVSQDEEYA